MRTSCIPHPENGRLLIIRDWQIAFCDGNACAAALLSFLEYWHNIKLEQVEKATNENAVAERHGKCGTQNTSLWQFHTAEELSAGIMGLYARGAIREAIAFLEKKQAISVSRNPNPEYRYDNTRFFLFKAETVCRFLKHQYAQNGRLPAENGQMASAQIGSTPAQIGRTIPEITTEITEKTSSPSAAKNAAEGGGSFFPLRGNPYEEQRVVESRVCEEQRVVERRPGTKRTVPAKADPRHAECLEIWKVQYLDANQEMEVAPWSGFEAKLLSNFLKNNKRFTVEQFGIACSNYFASKNTTPSACARDKLLHNGRLFKYLTSPLDEFDKGTKPKLEMKYISIQERMAKDYRDYQQS